MAITKATSEVACPLFSGRGLDLRGFTLKMPYKTYLTCDPSNIAAERSMLTVFNYDLAEYVYNKAADGYGFGVYVETGAYTDAITDGKHMYGAKIFLKLSEAYSLGAGERHNCDVRALATGLEVAYDLSGVAHGAYIGVQFKEDSDGVTIGGYYLANTQTYGVIGVEIRTEAKDNGDGGITVGAAAFGCVGLLVAQKNDAAWTGNYAGIALHTMYEGSDTITGTIYGIRFDDGGLWAGSDFDVGIDFADTCTTAIDIGACTTGITFTGDCTTAIEVTSAVSATQDILLTSTSAKGLSIDGAHTTAAIEISAGTTIGLHIKTTVQADGILIAAACTDGIHISGASAAYGINISGDQTTAAIIISGTDSIGISISSACADGIKISGACTDAIEVSGACDRSFAAVFNYTASMATYVQGMKIECTRASDIIVATSGVWGIQCVINQGTGYSAKMATQVYAGHFVIKGDAVNAGTSPYALVVETQSNGKVDYLEIHRLNSGSTTVAGTMIAFVSYVNVGIQLSIAAAGGTTGNAIYITDNSGAGTITDVIETDVNSASFFLRSVNADCGYLAGSTAHDTESDEIKVQIGSVTKYIKLYT